MLEVWLSSTLPRAVPESARPAIPVLLDPPEPAPTLRYALVTPARNESENLPRLAASLAAQTRPPERWIVVDTGSTDDTREVVARLAMRHPWIELLDAPPDGSSNGGALVYSDANYHAKITRAFEQGVRGLDPLPDVVVKLDADVSFEPEHFERLLGAFAEDDRLAIASGYAEELEDGSWRRRHNSGASVWGAARAYRRDVLPIVLPLEPDMGWDGIDELKVQVRGWRTGTMRDLPFRHHRPEGARDGNRWRPWTARGRGSHYMGYRPWYLVLRALHHARREPHALGMVWGYAVSAASRRPVLADVEAREALRRAQSIGGLRARRRDVTGAVTP
jgi:glycosyltransferase involved in cell wall biosynthesis